MIQNREANKSFWASIKLIMIWYFSLLTLPTISCVDQLYNWLFIESNLWHVKLQTDYCPQEETVGWPDMTPPNLIHSDHNRTQWACVNKDWLLWQFMRKKDDQIRCVVCFEAPPQKIVLHASGDDLQLASSWAKKPAISLHAWRTFSLTYTKCERLKKTVSVNLSVKTMSTSLS